MGLIDRMSTVVKSKVSKVLDRFEDPRETLDYSYQKQLEMLRKVKRGVAEVATSKKRLEIQRTKLQTNIDKHTSQAKAALEAGREDLARTALTLKAQEQTQFEQLTQQIVNMGHEQDKLVATEKRLSAKVESFRSRKETIKAQYTAAEAQVKITESVSGIGEEMTDVGLAIQRAEDKTENMRARSEALDELIETGTLEDTLESGDSIERELAAIKQKSTVDEELEALQREVNK
ncbi:MAG: PspA/IM30 family protein [Candidatus Argoarchaeum ethanivorans]|uniref:PspA/IM30 family protein n=1 Tax=Candidatus Argoarchaeum ethanivorans TaxID=2608793 RepID=A0A811T9P5_9EURY|nr:MAG: PspA/IM30 family protein [Candidatus Argoarchaeum ethanivorans]